MQQDQLYRVRGAAVQGFLAVSLGAFGAHLLPRLNAGLPALEAARRLTLFGIASKYQLAHAAALLALGAFEAPRPRAAAWAASCLFWGTLIFAGTLYLMGLGAPLWLGAVTPVGGTLMLAGWVLLGLSARTA